MMPVPASRVNTLATTSPLAPRTHTEAPALPHEPPEVASSVREDPECLRWGGNARQKEVWSVVVVAAPWSLAVRWCPPRLLVDQCRGSGVQSPPYCPTVIHGWMCLCVSPLSVELMSVEQEPAGAGAGALEQ